MGSIRTDALVEQQKDLLDSIKAMENRQGNYKEVGIKWQQNLMQARAKGPEVVVKPQAYIKMVKHVLLYGNSNLADSVEVMGICYGKEEDGKLIQYDAVPISHGGAIEVEFS